MKNTFMIRILTVALLLPFLSACEKDPAVLIPTPEVLERSYGGAGDDKGYAIAVDPHGNVYLAGSSNSHSTGEYDGLLVKIRHDGSIIWMKRYGGAHDEEIRELLLRPNGNVIMAGSTSSYGDLTKNGWFLETDSEGNLIQNLNLGFDGSDNFEDMILLSDGSVALTGVSTNTATSDRALWAARIDASYNVSWSKKLGSPSILEGGNSLAETASGQLLIFGFHEVTGSGNRDLWLLNLNMNGDSLNSWLYGGDNYEEPQSIERASDGTFLLCAHTMSFGLPDHNMYALSVAPDGSVLWQENYGGLQHDGGEHGIPMSSGNLLCGRSVSFGNGEQVYLVKTDADGSMLSQRLFGAAGDEDAQNMIIVEDHAYICGRTTSSNGTNDFYFLRVGL
jgi:hypothetical protein